MGTNTSIRMGTGAYIELGALNHYGIEDVDSCYCWLCKGWHPRREIVKLRVAQFEYGKCKCVNCQSSGSVRTLWQCLNYQKSYYDLLAISNQRDLWIEMSFHASHSKELGNSGLAIMVWLKEEIIRTQDKPKWWAFCAEKLSLAAWFDKYNRRDGSQKVIAPPSYQKQKISNLQCETVT